MPAIKVDDHDLLAVYHAIKKAREMVMERKGPVLVEAYTYRGGDHSTSDSATSYRTKERMVDVNKYLESLGDPITRLAKHLKNKGFLADPEARIKQIQEKVKAECLENLRTIDQVKMPHYEIMFEGVYHNENWNIKEQRDELNAHLKKYPEAYPLDDFQK